MNARASQRFDKLQAIVIPIYIIGALWFEFYFGNPDYGVFVNVSIVLAFIHGIFVAIRLIQRQEPEEKNRTNSIIGFSFIGVLVLIFCCVAAAIFLFSRLNFEGMTF